MESGKTRRWNEAKKKRLGKLPEGNGTKNSNAFLLCIMCMSLDYDKKILLHEIVFSAG